MLKKILFVCIVFLFAYSSSSQKFIPEVGLKTLNGESIKSIEAINQDGYTIISFWATWCIPCINELDAIVDIYEELEKDNIEVIAISTDDARTKKRVRPMINGKDWNFKILLDENHDLKRALNIVGIPHTIITKGTKIIYRRIGYSPGEEVDLFEFIREYE